ncbi:MAG: hypothetical protein LBH04_11150 [Tannerellaceae bacterium]|nr:hypothetical protein [Tannerellaceae bacterium]
MNKFLMFTVALGIVFLSSCTNEEKIGTAPYNAGDGYLSFILPFGGKTGPVTYGIPTTLAADSAEREIKTLKIYWLKFNSDPSINTFAVHKVFAYPTPTGGELPIHEFSQSNSPAANPTANGETVVQIATGTDAGMSHFYIVANVNGTDGISSTALRNIVLEGTTEAQFKAMLSDALEEDAAGNLEAIKCPLPMSLTKQNTGGQMYLELDPVQTTAATARMIRRVARFDIINNADFTNFKIQNVIISNANTAGFLQDTTGGAFAQGKTIIDVAATANGTPLTDKTSTRPDKKPDAFFDGRADSMEVNESQFYLYPTTLKADGSKTVISLEGMFNGETHIYTLKIDPLVFPGDSIPILANSAYKIIVNRNAKNSLDLTLTIDDWDFSGDSIKADIDSKTVTFGHAKASPNDSSIVIFKNGRLPDGSFSDADNAVDTIRYTVAPGSQYAEVLLTNTGYTLSDSINKSGVTSVTFLASYNQFLPEDMQAVIEANHECTLETIRTYGGLIYETTHKLKLPATMAPIAFDLQVASATNTSRFKKYYIESWDYNKLGYAPIKVGNLLWAPLNVGATYLPKVPKNIDNDTIGGTQMGNIFQWGRNMAFSTWKANASRSTAVSLYESRTIPEMVKLTEWLSSGPDAALWSSDSITPCPTGWRVPTETEFNALIAETQKFANQTHYIYYVLKSPSTDTLWLPLPSYMGYTSSAFTAFGQYGHYWTATNDGVSNKARAYRVQNNLNLKETNSFEHGYTFSLRAVRDYVTMPSD